MSKLVALVVFTILILKLSSCTADLFMPDRCSLKYQEGELHDQVLCGWNIPQPSEWMND